MKQQNTLIVSIILFLILLVSGLNLWTIIGLAYCAYISIEFTKRMGSEVPIPQMMLLIASMQWILGPWIDYITPVTHFIYYMYVPENEYMSFVVPAILAMHIGIHLFHIDSTLDKVSLNAAEVVLKHPNLPYYLIILGIVFSYIQLFAPTSIRFALYLLMNIKYIGMIYLIFSKNNNRWIVFIGIMLLTLISSIASGMFHDFLLWGILSFTFVCHELKINFLTKTMILVIGLFFVITIQAIKPKVRAIAWGNGVSQGGELALFYNLSVDEWRNGTILNPTDQNDINVRLNQGWIISKLMTWVPSHEPFAEGSTIYEAIRSSILPRFLNTDKAIANGKKNFEKYTGHKLGGASMGISLAGEGYANFGKIGGIIFLFIWGLFIGWFWKKLHEKSITYYTLILWSPLIFQQVIKAESELLEVLNHLIKASLLVWFLLYQLRTNFKIQI